MLRKIVFTNVGGLRVFLLWYFLGTRRPWTRVGHHLPLVHKWLLIDIKSENALAILNDPSSDNLRQPTYISVQFCFDWTQKVGILGLHMYTLPDAKVETLYVVESWKTFKNS